MKIFTDDLKIIQDELRNIDQLPQMIEFVRGGGIFSGDNLIEYNSKEGKSTYPDLRIEIAKFPDGNTYLHNGHHRAVAIYLGRPDRTIYSSEFYVKEWEYGDYMDINFQAGYVTPFDIRTEARYSDIGTFKEAVKDKIQSHLKIWSDTLASSVPESQMYAMRWIIQNPELYKTQKKRFTIQELADYHHGDLQRTSQEAGANA